MGKYFHKWIFRRWDMLILLLAAVSVRIYIYAVMHPVIHTDSITFLFLSELDMVRTPGYPLFIEMVLSVNDLFSITTEYMRLICFVQLFFLGVLNAVFIYGIARRLTSSRWFALAMGLLYNLNFLVVSFEFQLMTEIPALTLLFAVIFLYLTLFKGRYTTALAGGVFGVLLIYVRATYLLLPVAFPAVTFIGFWPFSKSKRFIRRLGPPVALFLAVSIIGFGAWSLRNKIKFDYFGISSLMPYQLRYYTNPLFPKYQPSGNKEVDAVAHIYREEFAKTGPASSTVHRFHLRAQRELGLNDAKIASLFLKAQLHLIRDYPGEYFSKIPDSLLSYYRQYSAYWASGNIKKFLNHDNVANKAFLFFFNWHKQLFIQPVWLIILLIAAPAVVLMSTFTRKRRFHGWLLILAVIHYNGFVSVFSTHAGINNLRYRIPAEPLILLFFYAAFFYLGKYFIGHLSKSKKQRDISNLKSQNPASRPEENEGA
jgi:hypothetical protein